MRLLLACLLSLQWLTISVACSHESASRSITASTYGRNGTEAENKTRRGGTKALNAQTRRALLHQVKAPLMLLPLRGGLTRPQEKMMNPVINGASVKSVEPSIRPPVSAAAVGSRSFTGKCSNFGYYIKSRFWSSGILPVHNHYLQLFWEVATGSFKAIIPIFLLLVVGLVSFPNSTKLIKECLEVVLSRLQDAINRVTLFPLALHTSSQNMPVAFGDYHQAFDEAGLPFWVAALTRPIVDAILFRWAIKTIWVRTNKGKNSSSPDKVLQWSILSSILYGLSHAGGSLPPTSPELLQAEVAKTLREGELMVFGMTLFRENWNPASVELLLYTQPLLKALGRGVVHGIFSWGLLCPLYELHGLLASIGAQLAWSVLGLRRVDTQIMMRILWRIFMPWSSSTHSTPDDLSFSRARFPTAGGYSSLPMATGYDPVSAGVVVASLGVLSKHYRAYLAPLILDGLEQRVKCGLTPVNISTYSIHSNHWATPMWCELAEFSAV